MGVYGATIGVAVAIGPLIGGALTDGLGWQSIFYLNVPIGAAALALTYLRLRESRDPHATRVDWAGVTTFSGALFLLVLALFKIPSFSGVQLAAFAVSVSLFATFRHLTLYLQNYLGYSPFQTGLRYLPITVLAFLFSAGVGALIGRVPARLLLSGARNDGDRPAAHVRDQSPGRNGRRCSPAFSSQARAPASWPAAASRLEADERSAPQRSRHPRAPRLPATRAQPTKCRLGTDRPFETPRAMRAASCRSPQHQSR